MELVTSLMTIRWFQKKIELCLEKIRDGEISPRRFSMRGCLAASMRGWLRSFQNRVHGSGDEQIADLYQEDIDTRMNNLLAVLGTYAGSGAVLIVGVILLSVMLPLMGIMSSI